MSHNSPQPGPSRHRSASPRPASSPSRPASSANTTSRRRSRSASRSKSRSASPRSRYGCYKQFRSASRTVRSLSPNLNRISSSSADSLFSGPHPSRKLRSHSPSRGEYPSRRRSRSASQWSSLQGYSPSYSPPSASPTYSPPSRSPPSRSPSYSPPSRSPSCVPWYRRNRPQRRSRHQMSSSYSPARSSTRSPISTARHAGRARSASRSRSPIQIRSPSPAMSARSRSPVRSPSQAPLSPMRSRSPSSSRSASPASSAGSEHAYEHPVDYSTSSKNPDNSKEFMGWCKKRFGERYHPSLEGLSQRFQFNMMRKSHTLTDMVLKCDGQTFPCHKLILASSSKYFERMFQCEMRETQNNEVTLKVISADILVIILDFMYTANMSFTWQKTAEVLRGADYLQMDTLKEMGSRYVMEQLKPSTALRIHRMAKVCNLERVERKAWHVITKSFRDVICSRQFVRLSAEELVEILESDELYVAHEDPVVHAALTWTRHKLSARRDTFQGTLLPLLRLLYCTKYMLSELISREPLMAAQKYQAQLAVALAQAVAPPCHQPRDNVPGPRDSFLQHAQCLVMYGSVVKNPEPVGQNVDAYVDYCTMYYLDNQQYTYPSKDSREPEWKVVEDIAPGASSRKPYHRDETAMERQVEYTTCALPRGLFVSGGREVDNHMPDFNYNFMSRRAAMFHFETLTWQDVGDMLEARYKHGAVYLNDEVFIVGGGKPSHLLSQVEVFDLISGQWQQTTSCIPHRVSMPAVAAHGLNVLVLGGQDSQERHTQHAQLFNTCLNRWQACARMPVAPRHATAVSLGEHLYVAGGLGPPVCLRYTPATDTWLTLQPPMFHHAHAGLSTCSGKLVLAGGLYEAEDATSPHGQVEVYSPDTDSWDRAPCPPLTSKLPGEVYHVCLAWAVYNDVRGEDCDYGDDDDDDDDDNAVAGDSEDSMCHL